MRSNSVTRFPRILLPSYILISSAATDGTREYHTGFIFLSFDRRSHFRSTATTSTTRLSVVGGGGDWLAVRFVTGLADEVELGRGTAYAGGLHHCLNMRACFFKD